MEIKNFTDLDAWKVNHQLILEIYKITQGFPKEERYGIVDQLRRAASSITANIAEGWGRFHYADRIKFYHQARGSNCEVQNFLILSYDLKYLDEKESKRLGVLALEGYKVVNGLIRSVEKFRDGR
ncbi:MAG: four helix bundle protein [bacterium]|nr:four helix bundle protein [bacterium]